MPFDSDLIRPAGREARTPLSTPEVAARDNKAKYLARYDELKKQGESFFPYTVFKDSLASLVVFLILVALAVFVGAPLEERADPGNTAYVPRPEWYFMFLFQMLKYFPGDLEWVGVVVVPGAVVVLLFLLPVLDRSWVRHPRQRALAMNLTAAGVAAVCFFTLQAYDVTPTTAVSMISQAPLLGTSPRATAPPQPRLSAAQEQGKRIFQSQNCESCHQLDGTGGKVGPDLTHVGARRDAAWLHEYIEKPKNLNPSATMPAFTPTLSHQEVEWLAQYLATLR